MGCQSQTVCVKNSTEFDGSHFVTPASQVRRNLGSRPQCNVGYEDKTNGNAKWWGCGAKCSGGKYWTDSVCRCACVKEEVPGCEDISGEYDSNGSIETLTQSGCSGENSKAGWSYHMSGNTVTIDGHGIEGTYDGTTIRFANGIIYTRRIGTVRETIKCFSSGDNSCTSYVATSAGPQTFACATPTSGGGNTNDVRYFEAPLDPKGSFSLTFNAQITAMTGDTGHYGTIVQIKDVSTPDTSCLMMNTNAFRLSSCNDGNYHHWSITKESTGSVSVSCDGVDQPPVYWNTACTTGPLKIVIGSHTNSDMSRGWCRIKGTISDVTISSGSFLKDCRWESNHDQNPNDRDYMGWTCADNEILTGFGLSADELDVTKVQCCKLGGHSSVKPDTCTYVGSNHRSAKCGNGKDHKVFSGAYDKRINEIDAVSEILAGKCCEVECDAAWCAENTWGVDKDNCQEIHAQGDGAQELVCPTGTLMTEIRDGLAGNAAGVQEVKSITCCALDLVAPPTQAPSKAPTTSRPTFAPSKAPTTSRPTVAPSAVPSTSPSTTPSVAPTTVDDCLLSLRDSSLTNAEFLAGIDLCLPGCRDTPQRRTLESRLLSENRRQ